MPTRRPWHELEREGRIVFRYCSGAGEILPAANPNGALGNIAGICNRQGNILGLMPHPERCSEPILGNADGLRLFQSILHWWGAAREQEVVRTCLTVSLIGRRWA